MDDLAAIAKEWLRSKRLLKTAYNPPDQVGYGWAPGELEEAKEQYENDIQYNERLIGSLKKLLASIRDQV